MATSAVTEDGASLSSAVVQGDSAAGTSTPAGPARFVDTRAASSRLIPGGRLLLGVGLLAGCVADAGLTPGCLLAAGFVLYAGSLHLLSLRNSSLMRSISHCDYWIDFGWLALLGSMEGGDSLLALLFPIVAGSIRSGFGTAMVLTVLSAGVCAGSGWAQSDPRVAIHVRRMFTLPAVVLVLGLFVARWGRSEARIKRRLEFLAEASRITNPRLGADHVIGALMQRLRHFYHAEVCLLAFRELGSHELKILRSSEDSNGGGATPVSLPGHAAKLLLQLSPHCAVVFRPPVWWNRSDSIYCSDRVSGKRLPEDLEASHRIAAALEAESFISAPLVYGNQNLGRLYLTSRERQFDNSDMYFILQVLAQVMPIVHNIRLVDRLTLDAAAEDRKRIARDLHDGVIQPYVGVRLGLDALRSKVLDGSLQVEDIDRLVAINQNAVSELRAFLFQLRNQPDLSTDLPGSVRRFARKFEEGTGITVEVAVDGMCTLSERLSVEAFMMVTEGLSNIRRHTEATSAKIGLGCPNGHLRLTIENPGNGSPLPPFTPRTITERAEALGGCTTVECLPGGASAVVVEVPL